MKRRIFLYNAVVVLLALIVLLAVSGLVIRRVSSSYRDAPPPADGSLPEVQSLLEDWQQERTGWHDLDGQLRNLGYALYVCIGSSEVYSSMSHIQWEMVHQLPLDEHWPTEEPTALWMGSASVVGMRAGPYAIFAMGEPSVPKVFGRQRLQTEALLLSVLIIGATTIVVIVLLSMLSTHFQVKHILRPVNALTAAARRIEAGDYSQGVGYDGQDEFTAVCAAFEHMQRHLLLEREKNAAYERARTDLVAGISHDLRTPLTSVKGYLKGLRDGVANTPEKQAQYLDIAYRKACDMDVLLQRLFYFSKLETGNLPLFPVSADLWSFVEGFVRDTAGELEQRGGTIRLKGTPAPHPVRIDTEQMYRVLTNLTDNALRYAGAEALVLTLTVWRERNRERLRFADNGSGVPEEDLPHLFEQFWRGDQSRGSQGGEGSGLGLYIVKYIVEAHGGTISARNDGGLVFDLALPCEEDGIRA
ncbi:MAG TPA: HAMP domain-containing histidine kinase [Candidatus Intestinimonas stercorigallinarum]|nr:HAMP domain-containing histidine kinase [Candidatus Intestinimonas stercorigallinarum]